MADVQGANGASSAGVWLDRRRKPRAGLRLAAVLLTVGAEVVTLIGLLGFVGRFLFPMSLPSVVVGLAAAVAQLLVLGAALAAVAAALALLSRARRVVIVCAAGTLAIAVMSIAAEVCLYRDFSLRQRLAAWQCRPGYRFTFVCQSPDGADDVRKARSIRGARAIVAKRLDPLALGAARVVTAPPDRIMVALDRRAAGYYQENFDRLVRFVEQRGVLEFRVLPTTDRGDLSDAKIVRYTEVLTQQGPKPASDDQYTWVEIRDVGDWHMPNSVTAQFADKHYVLASNKPEEVMLYSSGDQAWRIKKAYPTEDADRRRAIGFTLDEQRGDLFWKLTGRNGGHPLAILLDNVAVSAPTINPDAPIRNNGIITGDFTATDVYDMAQVLNTEPLPFALHLVENTRQN